MFSSFLTTSVASVDRPLAVAQTSPDLPLVTEESKDSQFSSSFSIRSILSSSSTSPPPTRFFSPFSRPQLLLAADSGPADYFPLFPHHCCTEGACAVNWQTDANDKKPAKRKERGKQGKRSRTIFTPVQLEQLESTFCRQQYVAGEERRQLAASLKLTETHVKVWFQNRRIRLRKQANQQTSIVEKAPSNELDV